MKKNHSSNENNIEALVNENQNQISFEKIFFYRLDSGHIQSESPSPTDLSPPSTSPLTPQILPSTTKSESITFVS